MSDLQVGAEAPMHRDMLNDPQALSIVVERLMHIALQELDKGREGRAYTVARIRIAASPNTVDFIRDMARAELWMDVTFK